MSEAIVIAPPKAHAEADALAAALASNGVDSEAPDVAAHWSGDGSRMIIASWPAGAFIVFCIIAGAGEDEAMRQLIWQATPMREDPTGRFVFARLGAGAADEESYAPFFARHFTVSGADAAAIAAHVAAHREALASSAKALDERRKKQDERVLHERAPADAPVAAPEPERPLGVGASDTMRFERHLPPDAATLPGVRLDAPGAPRAAAPAPAPPPLPRRFDRVDARAFAPKKLRRGMTELVRVAVFQPKDRARALRAAKLTDPNIRGAGAALELGQVARGTRVSAVMDARGAVTDNARIDLDWAGTPLDFNFPVEAASESGVRQALFTIRILADDAQIGTIAFVRPIVKSKSAGRAAGEEKLRRVERVFLSYSSDDRSPVAMIASAYRRAGIACFFDRASLKSGEEWSPRLLDEIARADLFHLCWSRHAASSAWVERETAYAMTARRKRKRPDITIQMLDGPPWAPHPVSLDALNFDDFERAAIVGYARGETP